MSAREILAIRVVAAIGISGLFGPKNNSLLPGNRDGQPRRRTSRQFELSRQVLDISIVVLRL